MINYEYNWISFSTNRKKISYILNMEFTKSGRVAVAFSNGVLASIGWYYFFQDGDILALITGLGFSLFLILEIKGILKK